MTNIVENKTFLKTFFVLTCSIALQNLLTYSVNLADNMMIGRYSQDAMSAISICNQFQFLLQMLVAGVSEGVVVLGAQYWGKKDYNPIRNIIGVGLCFGITIAVTLFLIALFLPEQILGLLSNEQKIVNEGVKYLNIVCFTYVIFTVTNTLTASLRAIGIVKIGYILSFSTLIINVVLNSCLIYGKFGFPELGIQGAAIATLVSRSVELCIAVFFLKYKEKLLNLSVKSLINIDKSYFKDYIKISLPLLVTQTTWGLAQIIQTGIIGNLSDAKFAIPANAISVLTFQIISVVGYGAAGAAAILTGKAVGENNLDKIKKQTKDFQLIFLVLGIITGISIYLSTDFVISFYPTLEQNAITITKQFIFIMAITSVGTCYQMATDVGVIRAGGSTSFSMKNNAIFTWVISLPLAYLSAYVWGLPTVIVFFWLKSDQLLKCPIIFIYANSYKWIKNVTR